VDLPKDEEREAIWRIQIGRHGRKPEQFDLHALVQMSVGYTGAEIEQAVIDAMYSAFADEQEPTTALICQVTADSVPLSKLMAEQIAGLRKWACGRCRMATSPVHEAKGRRIAA
jgi:SpoVK/Ycf46/Vps4 family AAA+-type ATPase